MPKLALLAVATLYTGGMVALGIVSIPNAMKAYESSRSVPFVAEKEAASASLQLPTHSVPESAVVVIDEVEVVGNAKSAFRALLQRAPRAPAEPVVKPAEVAAPCSSAWKSLSTGPAERRYRPLCPDELETP